MDIREYLKEHHPDVYAQFKEQEAHEAIVIALNDWGVLDSIREDDPDIFTKAARVAHDYVDAAQGNTDRARLDYGVRNFVGDAIRFFIHTTQEERKAIVRRW